MMNNNLYLFLDIDGVLATANQFYSNPLKWHPKYKCYKFDNKCVKVFNDILNTIQPITPIIILSSDWGGRYTINELNEIFEWNNVHCTISDLTPKLWNVEFNKLSNLEECRASEILKYVKDNNINKFIVIDDLNLFKWFESNFIHTPRVYEGIKQTGINLKLMKMIKFINDEK